MAPTTNFEAATVLVLMALDVWWVVDGCMRSENIKESLILVCPKDKEVVAEMKASVAPVSWTKDEFLVTTTYTLKGIYQTVPVYGAAVDVTRFFHEGQHYVEYKAVDEAGNFNQCSFVITVRVRRCPAVSDPQLGTFTCTASNLFGSECSLSCFPGYSVSGAKMIDCLEDGSWSTEVPFCRLTTCPDPGTPLYGTRSCTTNGHAYGSVCSFDCPSDFQLIGNGRLVCGSSGEWLASPPICQEIVPPQVKNCPPATIRTTTTSHFAEVEKPPVVFVTEAGNEAQHTCSHFADDRRHNFTLGAHLVTCTAFDPIVGDRSISKCEFHVYVKANPCHVLHQPSNGSLLCSRAHGGGRATYDTICQLFCHNGFAHGRSEDGAIAGEYRCDHTGNWLPYDIIPSCVLPKRPLELKLPSEIYFRAHNCPIDPAHRYEIRAKFQLMLQAMIHDEVQPCAARPLDCIVEDTVDKCQLIGPPSAVSSSPPPPLLRRRLRRYVSQSGQQDDKVPIAKTPGKSDPPQIRRTPSFRLTIQFHFGTRIPEVVGLWPDEYQKAIGRLFGMADHLEKQLNRSLFDVSDRLKGIIDMAPEPDSLAYDNIKAVCDIGYSFNNSILQCVSCGPGSYYNTSQNRCVACLPETYQDEQAAFGCKRCPSGRATAYRGATDVSQCIDLDECLSSPCLNNGQCHNEHDRFACTCLPGYSGVQCEEQVYDCKVHSCLSGGTCLPDGPDNYTCKCRPNYSGDYCQFATVDGGWSEWSEWSSCSKSCDVGEKTRSRSCDSPIPSHGGSSCPDAAVETTVCNYHPCPKCTKLRRPYQGSISCQVNATEDLTLCTIRCQDGHAFHGTVLPVYACGRTTSHLWPHQSPDNPRALLPACTEQVNPEEVKYEFHSSLPLECASEETRAALQQLVDRRAKEATSSLDCLAQGSCRLNAPDIAGCRLEDSGGQRRRKRAIHRHHHHQEAVNVSVSLSYRTKRSPDNDGQEVELMKVKSEMQDLGADLLRESAEGSLYVEFNGSKVTLDSRQTTVFNSVVCHRGKMLSMDGMHCVTCAPGSYISSHQQLCVLCEIGFFQPKPGQSECIQCPKGMVTFGRGAVGQLECYANDTQPPDIPEEYYYIKAEPSSQDLNIAFFIVGGILMSAIVVFTIVFIVVWKRYTRSKAYSPRQQWNEQTQEQVHLCAITTLTEEKA